MKIMPMGNAGFYGNPVVLVRNDLHARYYQEIRNADDLESLLRWLKSINEPPGAAPGGGSLFARSGVQIVDLFLPGMGLTSLGGLTNYSIGRHFDHFFGNNILNTHNGNGLWITENGTIKHLFDLADECVQAGERFYGWAADGLIEIQPRNTGVIALLNYPVILTTANGLFHMNYTFRNYTLHVLNEFAIKNDDCFFYAIANPGTSIDEFLRLMEWMYSDIDNYKQFMYGAQDIDYGYVGELYVNPMGTFNRNHVNKLMFLDFYRTAEVISNYFESAITNFPDAFYNLREPRHTLSALQQQTINSTILLNAEFNRLSYLMYNDSAFVVNTVTESRILSPTGLVDERARAEARIRDLLNNYAGRYREQIDYLKDMVYRAMEE
jgi:hypothetical protein